MYLLFFCICTAHRTQPHESVCTFFSFLLRILPRWIKTHFVRPGRHSHTSERCCTAIDRGTRSICNENHVRCVCVVELRDPHSHSSQEYGFGIEPHMNTKSGWYAIKYHIFGALGSYGFYRSYCSSPQQFMKLWADITLQCRVCSPITSQSAFAVNILFKGTLQSRPVYWPWQM